VAAVCSSPGRITGWLERASQAWPTVDAADGEGVQCPQRMLSMTPAAGKPPAVSPGSRQRCSVSRSGWPGWGKCSRQPGVCSARRLLRPKRSSSRRQPYGCSLSPGIWRKAAGG